MYIYIYIYTPESSTEIGRMPITCWPGTSPMDFTRNASGAPLPEAAHMLLLFDVCVCVMCMCVYVYIYIHT